MKADTEKVKQAVRAIPAGSREAIAPATDPPLSNFTLFLPAELSTLATHTDASIHRLTQGTLHETKSRVHDGSRHLRGNLGGDLRRLWTRQADR